MFEACKNHIELSQRVDALATKLGVALRLDMAYGENADLLEAAGHSEAAEMLRAAEKHWFALDC